MRILFVSDNPHLPQTHGGVEWNTHELCQALIARGIEAAVLSSIKSSDLTGILNRLRRRTGLWGDWPADSRLGYPTFRGWDPAAGLADVVRRWRPDHVIVQGSTPAIGRVAQRAGVPVHFYFHHLQLDLDLRGDWRQLDGFLACSPFIAATHRELYQIEITPIRPLVRPARCATSVRPRVLLTFGLQPIKGSDIVLDVAEARPDIPVIIVETWTIDREATERLRLRASKLKNVSIAAPHHDVRRFLAQARLLMAPSRWLEAWGRVVTEAQVNGIPVLASDRGGLPEVVGDGGLCLDVLSSTTDQWTAAAVRFWDDPGYWRSMSEKARIASRRTELQENFIVDSFLAAINRTHPPPQD